MTRTTGVARDRLYLESLKQEHRASPHALWDRLREEPVSRQSEGDDGREVWVVTGYDEVHALLSDPRVSSDWQRAAAAGKEEELPFIFTDPPRHEGLRRHVMRHFGPPTCPHLVPDLEGRVTGIATEELDALRGRTRMDVLADYTAGLPIRMICRIVGVPVEDESSLEEWVGPSVEVFGNPTATAEQQELADDTSAQLAAYLTDLARSRRADPRHDLVSALVRDPEGGLSELDVVKSTALLFIAGHVTTVNATASTILELLRAPEALRRVRDDPSLVPAAFEEGLRMGGPVHFVLRVALADIPVGGTIIPAGADIRLHLAAANRDPQRFPDPGTFDPQRPDNQHLAFNGGPHFCFGAGLARMEARVMLTEWLRRVENPRLVVDPPPYRTSPGFVGPAELLVDYDRMLD